jgi:phosphoribosylaminoimidazole-succinocarboxamide synthase
VPGPATQGKVRDIYDVGNDQLLLVATDRLSAFDVILPNAVPNKGRILTAFSLYWYERVKDLAPNHLVTPRRWEFP